MALKVGDTVKFIENYRFHTSMNLNSQIGKITKIKELGLYDTISWLPFDEKYRYNKIYGYKDKSHEMAWKSNPQQLVLVCPNCLSETCPTIREI